MNESLGHEVQLFDFFFCSVCFSLKLECEKLASEKTEMQRHYVMVRSVLLFLSAPLLHGEGKTCGTQTNKVDTMKATPASAVALAPPPNSRVQTRCVVRLAQRVAV